MFRLNRRDRSPRSGGTGKSSRLAGLSVLILSLAIVTSTAIPAAAFGDEAGQNGGQSGTTPGTNQGNHPGNPGAPATPSVPAPGPASKTTIVTEGTMTWPASGSPVSDTPSANETQNGLNKCFNKTTTYRYSTGDSITQTAYGVNWTKTTVYQTDGHDNLRFLTMSINWGNCVYPPKGTSHTYRCPISVGPTTWSGPYGSNVDLTAPPVAGAKKGSDGSYTWTDPQITYSAFGKGYSPGLSSSAKIALYRGCAPLTGAFATQPTSYGNYRADVALPYRVCSYIERPSGWADIDLGCTTPQTDQKSNWYNLMCDQNGGVAVGRNYANVNFDIRLCQQTSYRCVASSAPTIKSPDGTVVPNGSQMPSDGGKWSFTWPAASVVNEGTMVNGTIRDLSTAFIVGKGSGTPFNNALAPSDSTQPLAGTPALSSETNTVATIPGWGKTTNLQAYRAANFNPTTGKIDTLTVFQRQWFTATYLIPVTRINPDTGVSTPSGTVEKTIRNYCDTTPATVTVVGARNASGR